MRHSSSPFHTPIPFHITPHPSTASFFVLLPLIMFFFLFSHAVLYLKNVHSTFFLIFYYVSYILVHFFYSTLLIFVLHFQPSKIHIRNSFSPFHTPIPSTFSPYPSTALPSTHCHGDSPLIPWTQCGCCSPLATSLHLANTRPPQ